MYLSIIIPNFNGQKLLERHLPKVIEAAEYYVTADKKAKVEIIVSDDASVDKSIAFIKSQIQKFMSQNIYLRLIENKKNLGFPSNVNNAVNTVKGEIFVLLNTDVLPEKDFLDPLLRHFVDENVFAVGCMDKSKEGEKTVLRGRGVGKWERGFLMHGRGEVDKTNTLWVSGGSGAFRKSYWDKLGGFNSLYSPFYWEDIDLSYRALKTGYAIFFEPKSIVTHKHEEGAIKKHHTRDKVAITSYRNQFIFTWINLTDSDLQISHVMWLPYHFAKALIRQDRTFYQGFFQAVVLLPKIIRSRFAVQKNVLVSDRDVLHGLEA